MEKAKHIASENNFFKLELVFSPKRNTIPPKDLMVSYLDATYCDYKSDPLIISCRAYDNKTTFSIDILFPSLKEEDSFKIISHEFEKIELLNITNKKIAFKQITNNQNDLFSYMKTLKFKINLSLDPQQGNFALIENDEKIYTLFMTNNNYLT